MYKLNGKSWLVFMGFFSALAIAGNERGGGTAPPLAVMPKDTLYECNIKLIQLGGAGMHLPVFSTAVQTAGWKQGEVATTRHIDLSKISNWSHTTLENLGRLGVQEVPVEKLPEAAKFAGEISLDIQIVDYHGHEVTLKDEDLAVVMRTIVQASNGDTEKEQKSEAGSMQPLTSKRSVVSSVKSTLRFPGGKILDQRTLEAECKRIQ